MEHDLASILRAIPLFRTLSTNEHAELVRLMTPKAFHRDEPLLTEGRPPLGLFVLLDGRVAVNKAKAGKIDHICDLDAGECVGELEIIEAAPCSASVVAVGEVQAAMISKASLEGYFASYPAAETKVLRQMVAVLAARLRQLNVSYTSLMSIAESLGDE